MRAACLGVLVLAACGSADRPCPSGHVRDEDRARAIVARLQSTPLGAALAAELPRTAGLCFSEHALNVVVEDHTLLLASSLPHDEAAARLGHFLVHIRDGLPLREPIDRGADCDALVARALDREAVAYVTEVRLQRALGVTPHALSFEFADDIATLEDAPAIATVRAYLEAHPTGAPHIDGLAAGYRERCLRSR